MHWLLVWQVFNLFAQFKTTRSHENYVFLYPFSSMAISPKINEKTVFYIGKLYGLTGMQLHDQLRGAQWPWPWSAGCLGNVTSSHLSCPVTCMLQLERRPNKAIAWCVHFWAESAFIGTSWYTPARGTPQLCSGTPWRWPCWWSLPLLTTLTWDQRRWPHSVSACGSLHWTAQHWNQKHTLTTSPNQNTKVLKGRLF